MNWLKRQWQELRPHFKWEILKALMLALIYPILNIFRHLPLDWWLFVGVFVLAFILLMVFSRKGPPSQAPTSQAQIVAPAIPTTVKSPIDVQQLFRVAYFGQLQQETEDLARAMIQSRPPDEREEFIIKFISTIMINAIYENVWLRIYRSQLLALFELNRVLLRREQLKLYYDNATKQFPQVYAKYSFDQWLEFLRSNMLVLEHPGQTFEITVRGKDFLKYMVHCGYTADQRTY